MAKLLTYYDLCSISDHKEFLGLSEDSESGTIINTLGRNIFLSIQLSNQQQIHSWTVLEKLSNKVIYDPASSKYVGVFVNKYLRIWDKSVKDINKIKKIKLSKQIHDLYTYRSKDTIVLYTDGTCESLANSLESRKLDRHQEKPIIDSSAEHRIEKVAYFNRIDNVILFTYFIRNCETNELEFVYYSLDEETLTPISGSVQKFKVSRADQGATLVAYCVVDSDLYPSLFTLWSDKRIFMLALRDTTTNNNNGGGGGGGGGMPQQGAPGYFIAMLNLFKIDQPMSIIGVSKDCIAIYGANCQQEGASLVLYNTRYNVAQSKQFFKVYFNNARFWLIGKYILLAYGQTLACVSFRITKDQLCDMIGSQLSKNVIDGKVDTDCINEEIELEECLVFDKNTQVLVNKINSQKMASSSSPISSSTQQKASIININTDMCGDNQTKLITNGKSKMNKNKKNLKNKNYMSASVRSHPTETPEQVENDLRLMYHENVFVKINRRSEIILSDMVQAKISSFGGNDVFSIDEILLLTTEMEKCGASEFEITDRCIPLLIRSNLTNDLIVCLRRYTNISDKMLIKSLQYFMNLKSTTLNREDELQLGSIKLTEQQKSNINIVLSCSFNSDAIKDSMRQDLDFTHVIALLNHIYDLLKSTDQTLEERPQLGDKFDTDEQLCYWFTTMLDAYYQQFILTKNRQLLEWVSAWKELIDEQIQMIRNMSTLSSILYNLVNGKRLETDQTSSKWYSVESVKLY